MRDDELVVQKFWTLDEHVIFPDCHICGKETSPYYILEADDGWLNGLLEKNLIYGFDDKKVVAFLCRECCNVRIAEEAQ